MNKMQSYILDVATYLPQLRLLNEDLATLYPAWPAEKIYEKTGIRQRAVAAPEETAGDMAYEAAINLFKQGHVTLADIDFVILCTQAPDYILPTTACILQDRLKISKNAGALDVNLGCSGYVYGLSLAKGLIETGSASCVLLLTADTYSKYIHPMDKSVRTIFGDGATATAITAANKQSGKIGPFVFGTDGSGAKNLIVEAGMARMPRNKSTAIEKTDTFGNLRTAENLYMNGPEVMSFTLREVPIAVEALLKKCKKTDDEIDYFVFHQANKFMLDSLRKKLELSEYKLPIEIELCGNTVSSTIPMVLSVMRQDGRLQSGSKL
jgi:3-oxoacyl-[acyl-carrier-protein] synthase-3